MLLTVISASFTRPADTIAYASGDLVANSDGAFYLQGGIANPYNIPLGGLLPYIGASAPNSAFALPYGQAISRTIYATLFSLINTAFGSGDGSTTFNLPDVRGRVIAGLDNMGGSNASRLSSVLSSTTLGATGGSPTQSIAQANLPALNWPVDEHGGHSHQVNLGSPAAILTIHDGTGTAFNFYDPNGGVGVANAGQALTTTTGITVSSGGSGSALTTTQPTIVANYILRII
jgi:microcystin-dependent protein